MIGQHLNMRLNCKLMQLNANYSNMRLRRRPSINASLTVLKKNKRNGLTFLCINTGANNKVAEYKLKGNVAKVNTDHVCDGKATIRLARLGIELVISKADSVDLRKFINIVDLAGKGLESDVAQPLFSAKSSRKPRLQRTMTIRRKEPSQISLPESLQRLTIKECGISELNMRVFRLEHLTSLRLNNNNLTELPSSISETSLTELNLQGNQLKKIPPALCLPGSRISGTLKHLNLGHNKISHLPENMETLKKLNSLLLAKNLVSILPWSIGKMASLKVLNLRENKLAYLPISMKHLNLKSLDLVGNSFVDIEPVHRNCLKPVPNLEELAARYIFKHRIPYNDGNLTWPCHKYLKNVTKCLRCKSYIFESRLDILVFFQLRGICRNVVPLGSKWGKLAPALVSFCSITCLINTGFRNRIEYMV